MQLTAVIESTMVSIFREPPAVVAFTPDMVALLKERYRFVQFPKTVEEYKNDVSLIHGFFEDFVINKIAIYNDGFLVTAATDTDALIRLSNDAFETLKPLIKVDLGKMPRRILFNSRIEVKMEPGFENIMPKVQPVCDLLNQFYNPSEIAPATKFRGLSLGLVGETDGSLASVRFQIEPRAGAPLNEDRFYSEAPVTTQQHCELIAALETQFRS